MQSHAVIERHKDAPRRPAKVTQAEPTAEQIAERAFEIYLLRGGGDGRDQDDWLEAEVELRREMRGDRPSHS